ncbi:ankyrin [Colletotrichum eremochloae]|nr:ankyrin [Colletotrichum eremochloae]
MDFKEGDTNGGAAFYFQFDKSDSRRRSVKSMLALFLSETTWRMWAKPGEAPTTRRVFSSLEYYRSWSLPVLFNLFTDMRRCKEVEHFVIILGCFDQCVEEERNWFLAKVLEHQSRTDSTYRLLRPATPQIVLSVLISTLPPSKQKTALAIFRWVKYAIEPMTIETLGHALAASAISDTSVLDIDYDQLRQDVTRMFSGAIVVEGRVLKFSHSPFYDTAIPDDDGDENPASIHGFLAEACLKYLMHHEVQQRYAKLSVDKYGGDILKKPLVLPGDDLLEYAVRFWAEHYRLSESYRPIELALEFFRTSLGLEDVIWFQQDAWLAITEAARNVQPQESALQDAIVWATSSIGSLDEFTWPESILSRAAASGLDSLVSALIKAGSNLDMRNVDTGEMAIHTAVAWGQKTVVRLLLDSKVDLSVRDDLGRTPLLLSAEFGASVHDKDESGVSVVNTAISNGEFEALERLLAAGADPGAPPLICAAGYGRLQCMRILLEHGADACADSKKGTPLYVLCRFSGVAEGCRLLIGKGAEPNQFYTDKEMLLHRAMRTGDKEMVGLLIEKGAQVDTPLAFAISSYRLGMVEFLLEKGASVNYAPEGANAPLFTTAFSNVDINIAELLLEHKADIHWQRADGWTAIHAAYDLPVYVALFLKHGADVDKMSDCGTVLMMSARWNFPDVLRLLLAHRPSPTLDLKFDYDPEDVYYGDTALTMAVRSGHHECANLLLEAGAGLDDKLKDAKFVLQCAGPNDSEAAYKMMRDLLDRGTKADHVDDEMNTALHGIGSKTPVKILQTLVDLGAPVDSPNKYGTTPLEVALDKGNVAAARYLVSKGARADVHVVHFGSFLHLVCQVQYAESETAFELFKLLLDAGADPNAAGPEPSRESLLHTVIRAPPLSERTRARIFLCLMQNTARPVNVNAPGGPRAFPVIAAAHGGHSDILEYLVRHGADVDVADALGRRAVHYVAAFGRWRSNTRAIRVLAKAGADMQAADRFGRTVLHFVAGTNDPDLFESVLKKLPKGYDVDVRDNDGWTPLMWACRISTHNPIIEMLVKTCGADIWPRSADGEWSALKLACFSGQDEDVKGLLQPPAHEREREGKDGSTQVWDSGFHDIPPAMYDYAGWGCDSCFVVTIGTRHKCTVCEDYDLCFKCFVARKDMHNEDHELKEYSLDGFVGQEHNGSLKESEMADEESNHGDGDKVGRGDSSSIGVGTDTDDDDDFDSEDE